MKERGLSEVVTTLIIILLVLVSVGIIWGVVSNLLGAQKKEVSLDKFSLSFEVKKVEVNGDLVTVNVKRNQGGGDVSGLNLIFSDGSNSEIKKIGGNVEELEEKRYIVELTDISTANLKYVSVAPYILDSEGYESVGTVSSEFKVGNASSGGSTPSAVCNNGIVEGTEACDDGNQNGVICTPIYGDNCTYCSSDCSTIEVVQGDYCGDEKINILYEDCDGTNLGGETCKSQGYPEGGILLCNEKSCTFDTSKCEGAQVQECGDGIVTGTEQCDCGKDWEKCVSTCSEAFPSCEEGNAICISPGEKGECTYNVNECKPQDCSLK